MTAALAMPGSEGGGVADVLFGEYDFQGRLSFGWYSADAGTGHERDQHAVRFPSGFGLSYGEDARSEGATRS